MMLEKYIFLYKEYFKDEPIIDEQIKSYLIIGNWDEALKYAYNTDNVNIFKLIYLMTSAKFPIDYIVEMESIIADTCGQVCKPRWNGKGIDLEVLNYVISDKYKEKYSKKLDMIKFIINCRGYSMHVYTGNKFYYYFKIDKYSDRIVDILREMC